MNGKLLYSISAYLHGTVVLYGAASGCLEDLPGNITWSPATFLRVSEAAYRVCTYSYLLPWQRDKVTPSPGVGLVGGCSYSHSNSVSPLSRLELPPTYKCGSPAGVIPFAVRRLQPWWASLLLAGRPSESSTRQLRSIRTEKGVEN